VSSLSSGPFEAHDDRELTLPLRWDCGRGSTGHQRPKSDPVRALEADRLAGAAPPRAGSQNQTALRRRPCTGREPDRPCPGPREHQTGVVGIEASEDRRDTDAKVTRIGWPRKADLQVAMSPRNRSAG